MWAYIIRRLTQAMIMLFVLSIGYFGLIHLMPGGPEAVLFSPRMTLATRLALRHAYGLDKPLPVQYFSWLGSVLHGNFGNSFSDGQPVWGEITGRLPATVELFLAAMSIALVFALLLGVFSAVKKYSALDYMVTVLAYFGISMPIFWFGLILQEIVGVQLHLLPTFGQTSIDTAVSSGISPITIFFDYAQHLILPSIVLSLLFIAGWSRYVRSSMITVLHQDYIRTARAKGLSVNSVYFRHALRNALIPFITQVAIDFGLIVGGATITETVFAWPGLGRLFFDALTARDFPIIEAMLLMGSASVIFFNLLADIIYGIVDPRISYS